MSGDSKLTPADLGGWLFVRKYLVHWFRMMAHHLRERPVAWRLLFPLAHAGAAVLARAEIALEAQIRMGRHAFGYLAYDEFVRRALVGQDMLGERNLDGLLAFRARWERLRNEYASLTDGVCLDRGDDSYWDLMDALPLTGPGVYRRLRFALKEEGAGAATVAAAVEAYLGKTPVAGAILTGEPIPSVQFRDALVYFAHSLTRGAGDD